MKSVSKSESDTRMIDEGVIQLRDVREWLVSRRVSTLNQIYDHFSPQGYPISNLIDALIFDGVVEFDAKYQVIRLL